VAETTPEQGVQVALRLVAPADPGDAPILYSNYIQATYTPEDLTLHFGWYAIPAFTEPPSAPVDVDVRPVAKVTIPLNLIRGAISVLQSQLEGWEKTFGMPVQDHPNPPAAMRQEK
jgi:hypothetical protein